MADVMFGTSGSTGEPKSVARSEESLRADARALVAAFPEVWGGGPPVVASVRPEHMYGALWRVRAPAEAGSTVDPAVVASVEELAAACARHGEIVFVTTPTFLEKALAHPDFAPLRGSFRAIVTSGSMLRGETALAVAEAAGVCPLEIYGSTEAGTVAFRRRSEGEEWTLAPGVDASRTGDGRIVVDSPFAMERPLEMPDRAVFSSPRRFLLLGRADRRVKILERYVSLTAVERAFESHQFVRRVRVEAYGDGVERVGALVVLSREGVEALATGTHSALACRLRRDLVAATGALAFPRRIRFVRELPENEQGKTTAAAARAALASWCEEPAVTDWRATDAGLSATLVFPPDSRCFKGHFPEFAILPGVAQLYFIRRFGRQAFADYPDVATYRRLKFQKIVMPGRPVSLSMTRLGEGRFGFSLSGGSGTCTSGVVERSAP